MKYFKISINVMILFLVFLISGCSGPIFPEDEASRIFIRVENGSELEMNDILVVFPEDSVNYGDLDKGEVSEYIAVTEAFRYAYVELSSSNKKAILQPIDYVGEKPLEPGKYTYQLFINRENFESDEPQSVFSLILDLNIDEIF